MEKVLLQNPTDYEAVKGEKFEMHYNILSLPLLSAAIQKSIVNRLNANPIYKVVDTLIDGGKFIVTVVIVENPFPLALAISAVITATAGFFIWASLDKVYKIVESPTGSILSVGTLAGAVAGIIGLFLIFKKR